VNNKLRVPRWWSHTARLKLHVELQMNRVSKRLTQSSKSLDYNSN
jgi:hypothetical protein